MESHTNIILLLMGCMSGLCSPQLSGLYTGPYFSHYTAGNVSVMEGDIAHLPCRVLQVKNHTVSWIRSRDSAILSIDGDRIIMDRRFSIEKSKMRGDYVLSISSVTEADGGRYECQISMAKKLSMFVWLTILVPSLHIVGPSEVFTTSGSSVQLMCTLAHSHKHDKEIIWLKNGSQVEAMEDTKLEVLRRGRNTTSRLTINNVRHE